MNQTLTRLSLGLIPAALIGWSSALVAAAKGSDILFASIMTCVVILSAIAVPAAAILIPGQAPQVGLAFLINALALFALEALYSLSS